MNFRELAEVWAKKSWDEVMKDTKLGPETHQVVKELGLCGKKVTGQSVEHLPRHIKAEGKLPNVLTFTKIFQGLCSTGTPHPLDFISTVCDLYVEYKKTRADYAVPLWAICSRGMRTLASFYREVDFRDRFDVAMSNRGLSKHEILHNPEEDVKGHADLVVKISEKEFRVWLFQLTEIGIAHTSDRIAGNRGALRNGIHIICGQNTLDKEQVETVHGWSLYSQKILDECIGEIEKILKNEKKVMNYSKVKEILKGPKDLLSKVTSFEV